MGRSRGKSGEAAWEETAFAMLAICEYAVMRHLGELTVIQRSTAGDIVRVYGSLDGVRARSTLPYEPIPAQSLDPDDLDSVRPLTRDEKFALSLVWDDIDWEEESPF